MFQPFDGLAQLREGINSKRISSFDREGGNGDSIFIDKGTTATIADIAGAGIIKHIWITIACDDPMARRNIVLRMYWDGEDRPSVESPIGDFFGQGWGEKYNFLSLPLAAAPQDGNSLVCYFPMPFGNGAKLTIENQSEQPIKSFYYYVDYEEHVSIGDDMGRFHAWWNRKVTGPADGIENEWDVFGPGQKNTTDEHNYFFANIEGKGHFVGVNYYVDNPSTIWYGEGDDMFLIDGQPWPGSLHGTGTEDFFNMSWCPTQAYAHPYFGFGKVANQIGWFGRTHCYRYFLQDPIYFNKSLRASIESGHANALTLDISSVSYWYQSEPHRPFPELPAKEQRQNMPQVDLVDIHRWRGGWRKTKGEGQWWGSERQ